MKIYFAVLFGCACVSILAQSDYTSRIDDVYHPIKQSTMAPHTSGRKFGVSLFGGLGKGGNLTVTGFGAGGSIRAHYKLHTLNLYLSQVNRLEYHGGQSDSPTLNSSYYGLTYGIGIFEESISASVGAGIGYSFVNMSTSSGVNYLYTHYEKYGGCIGGQFSIHGKYIGLGAQAYFNLVPQKTDFIWLIGLEIHVW